MHQLAMQAIEARGGLEGWNRFTTVLALLIQGGGHLIVLSQGLK
jgi:hypothetical protein